MPGKETQVGSLTVKWIDHAMVKIMGKRVICIDPITQVMKGDEGKADLIIVTHSHFDHFDPGAINRLLKPETEVVAKKGCDLGQLKTTKAREIEVGEELEAQGVKIKAVEAYNEHRFRSPGQPFHPKGLGMGVILEVEGKKFYYAGDTDAIPEMGALKDEGIDLAFLPIGGTYTMDAPEAAKAAEMVRPKIVIPTHYNFLSETRADPKEFKGKLEPLGIEVRIL